ncbi:hypothetical protein C7S13_8776 [Burkholderia cepacia]|nr:hypothetical protein [Burkholderia cepacia]
MFSHDVPLRRPGTASGGCGFRITKDARRVATRGAWAANGLTAGGTGRFYPHATRILTIATKEAERCARRVRQAVPTIAWVTFRERRAEHEKHEARESLDAPDRYLTAAGQP